MINNVLNAMSDPNFRIRAFSDYCAARQANYSQLINAVNAAIAIETLDDDDQPLWTSDQLYDQLLEIIEDCGLNPNMQVTGQQGYYGKLIDLLESIVNDETKAELEEVDSLIGLSREVKDAAGNIISTLTNGDMFDDFKQGLHSITALVASNTAYLQSNFAEAVTVYRDKISEVFANAFSDISGSVEYYSSLLQQKLSPQEYLSQIIKDVGIDELAEDDSTAVPTNANIYKYTGASPAGALDFTDASAAVNSVMNVGAKVVKSIGNALWSGAKWVFNKAKKYITETVVNPYDVYKIDGAASDAVETIDGFCYQSGYNWVDFSRDGYEPIINFDGLDKLEGNSYVLKLVSGEIFMNFDQAKTLSNNKFTLVQTSQFKPKPVTKEFFASFLDIILNDRWFDSSEAIDKRAARWNNSNITQLPSELAKLIARSQNIYYDTSSAEEDMYVGYCLGYLMTYIILRLTSVEIGTFDASMPALNFNVDIDVVEGYNNLIELLPNPSAGSITNFDFIKAVSGYALNSSNDPIFVHCPMDFSRLGNLVPTDGSFAWPNVSRWLIRFISTHEYLKEIDPLNYPFYPYRKNKERFSPSMYAIHSDDENKEAFNNFAVAVVVAIAVVALTLAGVVIAKRLSRAISYRRELFTTRMQSKMRFGATLTNREKRRYFRLQSKQQASNSITKGLLGNFGSTADDDASAIKDIYSLIRG